MTASIGSLTIGNRLLLYLLRNPSPKDEKVFPVEVTQAGISRALGIARSYVAVVIKRLEDQEYVEFESEYVIGKKRRLKVAKLTQKGRELAVRLKAVLREELKWRSEGDGEETSEGREEAGDDSPQQSHGGPGSMAPSTITLTYVINAEGRDVLMDD